MDDTTKYLLIFDKRLNKLEKRISELESNRDQSIFEGAKKDGRVTIEKRRSHRKVEIIPDSKNRSYHHNRQVYSKERLLEIRQEVLRTEIIDPLNMIAKICKSSGVTQTHGVQLKAKEGDRKEKEINFEINELLTTKEGTTKEFTRDFQNQSTLSVEDPESESEV
jgi:hypothetical protein